MVLANNIGIKTTIFIVILCLALAACLLLGICFLVAENRSSRTTDLIKIPGEVCKLCIGNVSGSCSGASSSSGAAGAQQKQSKFFKTLEDVLVKLEDCESDLGPVENFIKEKNNTELETHLQSLKGQRDLRRAASFILNYIKDPELFEENEETIVTCLEALVIQSKEIDDSKISDLSIKNGKMFCTCSKLANPWGRPSDVYYTCNYDAFMALVEFKFFWDKINKAAELTDVKLDDLAGHKILN
jgi:hypothetical protein